MLLKLTGTLVIAKSEEGQQEEAVGWYFLIMRGWLTDKFYVLPVLYSVDSYDLLSKLYVPLTRYHRCPAPVMTVLHGFHIEDGRELS